MRLKHNLINESLKHFGWIMSNSRIFFLIIFLLLLNNSACTAERHKTDDYSLGVTGNLPVRTNYEDNVIQTTICEVNNREELFVGKQLLLTAIYESNMRHGSFLLDKKCKKVSYRVGYYNENIDQSIIDFNEAQI
jgi:hypothetical protein